MQSRVVDRRGAATIPLFLKLPKVCNMLCVTQIYEFKSYVRIVLLGSVIIEEIILVLLLGMLCVGAQISYDHGWISP